MLELIDVTKKYELLGNTDSVLKGITLKVAQGQSVAIVGPSGSGKSTLLNIIGALDRPTTGKVLLEGRDLSQLDDFQLAEIRNREIGFVFQLHHLLPQCTVLENVLIPTLVRRRKARDEGRGTRDSSFAVSPDKSGLLRRMDEMRAVEFLERVGLKDYQLHRPGELSGGQRQRVAVVRALINRPRLLLADEPTGSLDEATAQNISNLLVELNRSEGIALIVVTHSLHLAGRIGKVYELSNGLLKDTRLGEVPGRSRRGQG
jgi:ABC-type lipoprotein export system ATPase subunit